MKLVRLGACLFVFFGFLSFVHADLAVRRVPLSFSVLASVHDDSHLFLISSGARMRLVDVDISRPGLESVRGDVVLPQPGRDASVYRAGIFSGTLYVMIKWTEGEGYSQEFPTQLYGKAISELSDSRKPWRAIGEHGAAGAPWSSDWGSQTVFDSKEPYVYILGSYGLGSGLIRVNLRTGQRESVARDLPLSMFTLTDDYIVLNSTICCDTQMTVIDKHSLKVLSSEKMGEFVSINDFIGSGNDFYFKRMVDRIARLIPKTELVLRSGAALSESHVTPFEDSIGESHLVNGKFLNVLGVPSATNYPEPAFKAALVDPRSGSTCELGSFRSEKWFQTNDYVGGDQPRLLLTNQASAANELLIVDLNFDSCR